MRKPRCLNCQKKPARVPLVYFCTLNCALETAISLADFAGGVVNCDACNTYMIGDLGARDLINDDPRRELCTPCYEKGAR